MSGGRDESLLLGDIVEKATRLIELGAAFPEDPASDCGYTEGVLYNVIILGEAAKRLPVSTRERFPDVPWSDMSRIRDRVVHHYEGIDWFALRGVMCGYLPAILPRLVEIRDTLRTEFDAAQD